MDRWRTGKKSGVVYLGDNTVCIAGNDQMARYLVMALNAFERDDIDDLTDEPNEFEELTKRAYHLRWCRGEGGDSWEDWEQDVMVVCDGPACKCSSDAGSTV